MSKKSCFTTIFVALPALLTACGSTGAGYDKWAESTNKSISDSYTSLIMGGKIKTELDPAVPKDLQANLAYRIGEGVGVPGRGTSAFYNKLSGDVTYPSACKYLRFSVAIFNHDNALIQTEPVIVQSYDAGVKALINRDVLADPSKSASSSVSRLLIKDFQCVGEVASAVPSTPAAAPPASPASTSTASDAATRAAWIKAVPLIQAALECRGDIDVNSPPLNALAPPYVEGDWKWEASPPVPLKVFGLTVSHFELASFNSGEGFERITHFSSATREAVKKAARLTSTKDVPQGTRKTKLGEVSLSRDKSVALACSREVD